MGDYWSNAAGWLLIKMQVGKTDQMLLGDYWSNSGGSLHITESAGER